LQNLQQRDLQGLNQRVEEELKVRAGDSTFSLWLSNLKVQSVDAKEVIFSAPKHQVQWVNRRYLTLLKIVMKELLNSDIGVKILEHKDEEGVESSSGDYITPSTLNRKYTFDNFVIGEENRLAHAASLAVSELPGQTFNPLFIYGRQGVGKTHLLHSIGHFVTNHDQTARVRYITTEAFVNQFTSSIRSKSMGLFKKQFRNNRVLLIDDIQFLQNKSKTEEELFHTFNALYETGNQLVIASDRPPNDLSELQGRLRERFQSGLVTEIEEPGYATRLAVLKRAAHRENLEIEDGSVLEEIASRVTTNIRSLEGALIRVVAYHSLTRKPIDRSLTEKVLEKLYPKSSGLVKSSTLKPKVSSAKDIAAIQRKVCEEFGTTLEDLTSHKRTTDLVWARQTAIYLCRELTSESLPKIGTEFGGRSHSTVMHAYRQVKARIDSEEATRKVIDRLASTLSTDHFDRSDCKS